MSNQPPKEIWLQWYGDPDDCTCGEECKEGGQGEVTQGGHMDTLEVSQLDFERSHLHGKWYVGDTADCSIYLRKDGTLQDGTGFDGPNSGYFDTKEQAQAALDAYRSNHTAKAG